MEQLSYLQKISKILEPGAKVFNTGNETGWKQLQLDMNIVLPTDYKEYIKIYGTGCIDDFLWVLNPFCMNENINFIQKGESIIDAYKTLRKSHPNIVLGHLYWIRWKTEYPKALLYKNFINILHWMKTQRGSIIGHM